MFINFEGVDGSGKTSVIQSITEYLKNQGYDLIVTREPGGTKISEQIREILLNVHNFDMLPVTEALLYAASRAQHVYEKILPALQSKKIVITDRYIHSSLAYQGIVKKLTPSLIEEINRPAINHNLYPDVTFILDVPIDVARLRMNKDTARECDRFDQESADFHQQVRNAFKTISKDYNTISNPIYIIDASKPLKEVVADILKILLSKISEIKE